MLTILFMDAVINLPAAADRFCLLIGRPPAGAPFIGCQGRASYDEKYRVIMSTSKAIFQNNRTAQ